MLFGIILSIRFLNGLMIASTMIQVDANQRGPLLDKITKADGELRHIPMEALLSSPSAEAYFIHEVVAPDQEPKFFMATLDGILVQIAVTGEPIKTVLERDVQGTYHLYSGALPVNGINNDKTRTKEQLLELLINYVHGMARSLMDPKASGMAKNFQIVTYDSLVARFSSLQAMQALEDIVPDQSPRTVVVKAGEGCVNRCAYCKLSGVPFRPYSADKFTQHLDDTMDSLMSTLGRKGIHSMNEGFINISDILLLDIQGS